MQREIVRDLALLAPLENRNQSSSSRTGLCASCASRGGLANKAHKAPARTAYDYLRVLPTLDLRGNTRLIAVERQRPRTTEPVLQTSDAHSRRSARARQCTPDELSAAEGGRSFLGIQSPLATCSCLTVSLAKSIARLVLSFSAAKIGPKSARIGVRAGFESPSTTA
jgi:hypothetical protein